MYFIIEKEKLPKKIMYIDRFEIIMDFYNFIFLFNVKKFHPDKQAAWHTDKQMDILQINLDADSIKFVLIHPV